MHDLLCDKKCTCGAVCYAHPDMPCNIHKCKTCLIIDKDLIEEDQPSITATSSFAHDLIVICTYFLRRGRKKWRGNFKKNG